MVKEASSLVGSGEESACDAQDAGDVGLTPELGRCSGGGNGNPLQFCLGNSVFPSVALS